MWVVCGLALSGSVGACGGEGDLDVGETLDGLTTTVFSDDFGDPTSLARWTIRNPDLATKLDVHTTTPGNLTVVPAAVTNNAWYSDFQAPFVFKPVTGNFVVETSVRVASTFAPANPAVAPTGAFNSAGVVVRDPASPSRTISGQQSWIMYNIGWQLDSFAREAKTTRRGGSSPSLSTLYLNKTPAGVFSARLRICRIGSSFRLYHLHPTETTWTEERVISTTQEMGNGAGVATPGVDATHLSFTRTDLPSTLQVGLIANAWGAPAQTRGQFDYIHLGAVSTVADCTAPILHPL